LAFWTGALRTVADFLGIDSPGAAPFGGAQALTPLALGNTSAAGPVAGLTSAQLGGFSGLQIAQTTTGNLALTLPNPPAGTLEYVETIANTGTAAFTMYGVAFPAGGAGQLLWNGTTYSGLAQAGSATQAPAGPIFVYQPGGTTTGNIYNTFLGAYNAAFAVQNQNPRIVFDHTFGSGVIAAGTYNLQNIILDGNGGGQFILLQDGVVLAGAVLTLTNGIQLRWAATTTSPVTLVGGFFEILLSGVGTTIIPSGAMLPFLSATGASTILIDVGATLGAAFIGSSGLRGGVGTPVVSTAGGNCAVGLHENAECNANVLAGAGTIVVTKYSSTAVYNSTQTGALALTVAQNSAQGGGPSAIVNGVLAVSNVILSTSSQIEVSVGTPVPGAGNLTVRYGVLETSRTNGAGTGSFTISALNAAGTLNALDQSTNVRWTITNT
jgi:hypothetical protein